MPARPLVTVVIPAYNAAGKIETALHAACSQTYRDLEVVVVDDGSTDDTAERVMAAADRDARIRLVQQSNRGVAAARNHGIRVARGSFIAPLDHDDLWLPSKIERQVASLDALGPAAGMAYTWWASIDAGDEVLGLAGTWRLCGNVADALVHLNFIGNASVPLFRRDVVERVGGYSCSLKERGGQGCEDWDLTLRVAERSLCAVVPAYLTGYRASQASMSSRTDQMAASFEAMLHDVAHRRPDLSRQMLDYARGHFYHYIAAKAFMAGHSKQMFRHIAQCVRHDPARALIPHLWRISLLTGVAWGKRRRLHRRSLPPLQLEDVNRMSEAERLDVFGPPRWERPRWRWLPFDWIHDRRWRRSCQQCANPDHPEALHPSEPVGTTEEKPSPGIVAPSA